MSDPWAFGWTQLLTIIGLVMTLLIAIGGFRTFGRWKREKLEERKIEIAFDALALAYESKWVFEHIRGPLFRSHEWADMPQEAYSTEEEKERKGPFYATFRRVELNKNFFDAAWRLQPRCMAVLGKEAKEIFNLLHMARRDIELATSMLLDQSPREHIGPDHPERDFWIQLRADRSSHATDAKEGDRVGKKLAEFRNRMEGLCRPVIDREYGKKPRPGLMGALADGLDSLFKSR